MRRRKTPRAKRRKSKIRNKLAYGITAICIVLICLVAFTLYTRTPLSDDQNSPKAALIDHLGFSSPPPNDTFKTRCRDILEYAGFDFTYHPGEQVTVDFYKHLPTYDYSLMILRVHSAVIKESQGNLTNLIGLFTSEVYNETTVSQQYLSDLHEGRLALARLFKDQDIYYFGITPFFVQFNMIGTFKNTVIIMMGCEGLNRTSMAEALYQKGAEVYISWTLPVTISHTDDATIRILQSLLEQNQTIKTAVELINPDPQYKGKLDYYPPTVGDNRIRDFAAI